MSITAWNPDRHCKTAGISRLGSYLLLQLCFWIQIHFQVLQVPAGITRLHAQVDSLVTMTMNFYCLTRNCFVFLQREATDSLLSFTAGTSPSVYEDTTRSYCTWRERERERGVTRIQRGILYPPALEITLFDMGRYCLKWTPGIAALSCTTVRSGDPSSGAISSPPASTKALLQTQGFVVKLPNIPVSRTLARSPISREESTHWYSHSDLPHNWWAALQCAVQQRVFTCTDKNTGWPTTPQCPILIQSQATSQVET